MKHHFIHRILASSMASAIRGSTVAEGQADAIPGVKERDSVSLAPDIPEPAQFTGTHRPCPVCNLDLERECVCPRGAPTGTRVNLCREIESLWRQLMPGVPCPVIADGHHRFLALLQSLVPPLTKSEMEYIITSPDGLNCLADFWSVQETLFDGSDDPEGARHASTRRKEYRTKAKDMALLESE